MFWFDRLVLIDWLLNPLLKVKRGVPLVRDDPMNRMHHMDHLKPYVENPLDRGCQAKVTKDSGGRTNRAMNFKSWSHLNSGR